MASKICEEDMILFNRIRNSGEKGIYYSSEYMEEMEISPCKIVR